MTHHKRGKPKNAPAGCLLCKPHKANGAVDKRPATLRAEVDEAEQRETAEDPMDAQMEGWTEKDFADWEKAQTLKANIEAGLAVEAYDTAWEGAIEFLMNAGVDVEALLERATDNLERLRNHPDNDYGRVYPDHVACRCFNAGEGQCVWPDCGKE
jgi:hypothetical protein